MMTRRYGILLPLEEQSAFWNCTQGSPQLNQISHVHKFESFILSLNRQNPHILPAFLIMTQASWFAGHACQVVFFFAAVTVAVLFLLLSNCV